MAVIETHTAVVQADFFQFYVNAGDEWPSGAVDGFGYEWRLWSKDAFAYVGTGGQHPQVTVVVEVLDGPPGEPGDEWDHVASTSIDSGGAIEICDWDPPPTPPALSFALPAGTWRLRVHWIALADAIADDGAPESMLIQLWSAPWSATVLDRCWGPWERRAPSDTSPDGRRQVEMGERVLRQRLALEPVGSFDPPRPTAETGWLRAYPPMPGGGPGSRCYHLVRDPDEDSWWVDGIDVRETMREVTPAEAQELQALPVFVPIPEAHLQAWRENRAREREA